MMSAKLFALLLAGTLTLSIATPAAAELRRHSGEQPRKTQTHQGRQDGSSIQRAVVIKENDTRRGIDAENAWIAKNLPGHQKIGQALVQGEGGEGIYDRIDLQAPDGSRHSIYFEISSFFGKINGKLMM